MADDGPLPEPPPDGTQAPVTPGGPEQTARQQAEDSGQPVVVDAMTTQTDQTVAQPDGSFSLTSYTQPVRVQKAGSWTEVDGSLASNPDGTYSPAATPNKVVLSGGGTGPLATLTDENGHSLSYTLPFALPAPTVSGDTALYRNVLPGVDLQAGVTDQGGFGEVLIVHDATAAANPVLQGLRLTTTTQGLTLTADPVGNLNAQAADGTLVYAGPTPLMWDSSTGGTSGAAAKSAATSADASVTAGVAADTVPVTLSSANGPGAGAQVQPVAVTAEPGAVMLTPDADVLHGPATTYPVFIDPYTSPVTNRTGHYTEVQEGCPSARPYDTPQDNGEGVGYQQFTASCFGLERSYYAINTSALNSQMIIDNAVLHLTETYGADHGCSNTWPLTLKRVDSISSGTDWDHQPGNVVAITTGQIKSAAAECGDQGVNFDLTSEMSAAADAGIDTWTFGLWGNETKSTSNLGFMRFATNPYITTTYDIPPNQPQAPSTTPNSINPAGAACDNGTPGWIGKTSTTSNGSSNITLGAWLTTPMAGANVRGDFQLWDNQTDNGSGTALHHYPPDTAYVASDNPVSTPINIPTRDGHQYGWGVRAYDGQYYGPWLTGCHFNVDLSAPTPPQIADSSAYPPLSSGRTPTAHAGDTGVTIQVSSTDPLPTGCTLNPCLRSGIRRFEYSLDSPIPVNGAHAVAPTAGSNGAATASIPVNLSAQQWGTHTLYVQAVDGADNAQPVAYTFYAPWNPDRPVKQGDLTNDSIPDLISPTTDGNLYLVPGDTDVTATPQLSSTQSQSPDSTSWNNYLVTHRGSTNQSGVDDLFAYNTATDEMYIYRNDAEVIPDGVPGHFTGKDQLGLLNLDAKPACNTAATCTDYDPTWASVSQILAPGTPSDTDYPGLITVEKDGHLWYYAGTSDASHPLADAVPLSTGDWSKSTLIAPGTVGGVPTLWARDSTGALHTYPLSIGSNDLPTQLLTAPMLHALTSVITTSTGGTLCAASGGAAVQIAGCDGSRSQQWTLGTDGTVHALGKCLDLADGSTANGTLVELDTCSGGTSQKWTTGTAGSLVNTAAGLCLADPSSSVTPGVQLIIWTCEGIADQNWTGTTTGTLPQREAVLPVGIDTVGFPAIASPGDVNSAAGAADGNPDLYAVTSTGKITEYVGTAPVNGTAQFDPPLVLGTLNKPTLRWS